MAGLALGQPGARRSRQSFAPRNRHGKVVGDPRSGPALEPHTFDLGDHEGTNRLGNRRQRYGVVCSLHKKCLQIRSFPEILEAAKVHAGSRDVTCRSSDKGIEFGERPSSGKTRKRRRVREILAASLLAFQNSPEVRADFPQAALLNCVTTAASFRKKPFALSRVSSGQ